MVWVTLPSQNRIITAARPLAHFLSGFGPPILQVNLQRFHKLSSLHSFFVLQGLPFHCKSKPMNNYSCFVKSRKFRQIQQERWVLHRFSTNDHLCLQGRGFFGQLDCSRTYNSIGKHSAHAHFLYSHNSLASSTLFLLIPQLQAHLFSTFFLSPNC